MFRSYLRYERNRYGFSLIELMIVVSIIGLLAAIAIPKFSVFKAKALQAEAKTNLSHIFTLETAYQMDKNIYPILCSASGSSRYGMPRVGGIISSSCTFATTCSAGTATNFLGFALNNCSKVRYGYHATGGSSFLASARSASTAAGAPFNIIKGCASEDLHTIDQTGFRTNAPNAIASCP